VQDTGQQANHGVNGAKIGVEALVARRERVTLFSITKCKEVATERRTCRPIATNSGVGVYYGRQLIFVEVLGRFTMASLRTEAEAVAIALEVGILSVDDAVHWAIRQLDNLDVPPIAICDAATAGSKYPQDVASFLRQVPGESDQTQAIWLVLRYALDALEQATRTPRQIARALFDLAYAGDLPKSKLRDQAWIYWDAIDLVRDGYSNQTEEQIVSDMASTLKEFLRSQVGEAGG